LVSNQGLIDLRLTRQVPPSPKDVDRQVPRRSFTMSFAAPLSDEPANPGRRAGRLHRLANPGRIALELIEVQTGSYLGEDDIVRLDDIYRRT
jgi:hypothetical protein